MDCIYALVDPRNQDIRYVGKTCHQRKRMVSHLACDGRNPHRDNWIRALLKEGLRPVWFVLEHIVAEAWENLEIEWIAILRDVGEPLTNLTEGGDGPNGFQPSEETRVRMSEAHWGTKNHNWGKPRSPETKRKMSEALRGERGPGWGKSPANKGLLATEETRRRLSLAHMGKTPSEETRRKLSEVHRGEGNPNWGKSPSIETRARMSVAAKGRWSSGAYDSPETKQRMVQASTGRRHSPETRARMSAAQLACNARKRELGLETRGPCSEETKRKISATKKLRWQAKKACPEPERA